MSFATGTVTYFLDIWKFVPGFFLFTLSYLLFYVYAVKRRDVSIVYHSPLLGILACHFLLTFFPAVFWSKGYDSLHLISVNIGCFCLVFLMLNLIRRREQLTAFFYLFVFILGVVSAAGILEYFGLFLWKMNTMGQGIASFFLYPTVYSGFVVLLLPAVGVSIFIIKSRAGRILAVFTFLIGFVNLILSQSRASLIAFFVVSVCFLILFPRFFNSGKRSLWITAGSAGLIIVLFAGMLLVSPGLREKIVKMFMTKNPRWMLYGMAVRMWLRNPLTAVFGNGIGSFKHLSFTFKPPGYRILTSDRGWDAVHNEYLELLVDGGIVSLIAFLLVCGYLFLKTYRMIKNRSIEPKFRYAALGIGLSLLAFLTDIFLSTNSRVSFNLFLFYLLVPLVEVVSGQVSNKSSQKRSVSKTVLLLPFLAVLVLLNTGFWIRFLSETRLSRALQLKGRSERTISLLEKARNNDPRSVHPAFSLAENYLHTEQFNKFFTAADRVEEKIPNFKAVTFMRGIAETALERFEPAAPQFEKYLHLDRYDLGAETYLMFVKALMNDWKGVTDRYMRIVEDDMAYGKKSEVRLSFPEGIHSVGRRNTDQGFVLEIGTLSMELIVREIISSTDPIINSYFFRFHYVLGNIYRFFELPELAVKHYSSGRENYISMQEIFRGFDKKEDLETDPGVESDHEKFMNMMNGLGFLLIELSEKYAGTGDSARETYYLDLYLSFFPDDAQARKKLRELYRDQGNYKASKQLGLVILP